MKLNELTKIVSSKTILEIIENENAETIYKGYVTDCGIDTKQYNIEFIGNVSNVLTIVVKHV